MFQPRHLVTALLSLLLAGSANADSPLTSTDFWKSYQDLPQVKEAHDIGRLNTRLGYYLLSKAPIDHKAAVINALSWKYEGRENAMLFREILTQKYGQQPERRMTAQDTFCLGYLTALDDYNRPQRAVRYTNRARQQMPNSFTVAVVDALVRAQVAFAEQDRLWSITQPVLESKTLRQDMRPRGKAAIFNYMKLYRN